MANITATMVKELRGRTGLGMMDCKKALSESNGDMEEAIKILREKGVIKSAKKSGRETNEGMIKLFYNNSKTEVLMTQINCETDFVVRNQNFQNFVDDIGKELINDANIKSIKDITGHIENKVSEAIASVGENVKIANLKRMNLLSNKEYIGNYIHNNSKVGVLLKVKTEKEETKQNENFTALIKDLCMQIAAMDVRAIKKEDLDEEFIQKEREIYTKQIKDSGKPEKIIPKIIDGKMKKLYSEITLLGQTFIKEDNFTVEKMINKVSRDLSDKFELIEFAKFKIG